jgi:hypothetical protein
MKENEYGVAFSDIAGAIDDAEATAGDRAGGPTSSDRATIRRLEAQLPPPAAAADWEWLARRLARALENGWHGPAAHRLIRLAA